MVLCCISSSITKGISKRSYDLNGEPLSPILIMRSSILCYSIRKSPHGPRIAVLIIEKIKGFLQAVSLHYSCHERPTQSWKNWTQDPKMDLKKKKR